MAGDLHRSRAWEGCGFWVVLLKELGGRVPLGWEAVLELVNEGRVAGIERLQPLADGLCLLLALFGAASQGLDDCLLLLWAR